MKNQQPPEPFRKHDDGSVLDLHSMFLTLQGEGPYTGHPALFIRLAGCSLQCPGCDTEYTQGRQSITASDLSNKAFDMLSAKPRATKLVVITGGEPTRQNLSRLCFDLSYAGYHIQIESNGMHSLPDRLIQMIRNGDVTLCVSPKTARINEDAWVNASYFKYVIDDRHVDPFDGLPTISLGHTASPRVVRPPSTFEGSIFVTPMDTGDDNQNLANMHACVKSALKFGYVCNSQAHKVWGLA